MKHESIKNQCWWHQSTTNGRSLSSYCEQHQYQFAEHLQAIHKASTSNERKINISALSININAESSNSHCTEHQNPMCSQSTANAHSIRLPYAWFLQSEDFHSEQYASHPLSFCAEPKAKSQNPSSQKVPFPKVCGGTVLKDPSASKREVILHLKESSPSGREGTACGG